MTVHPDDLSEMSADYMRVCSLVGWDPESDVVRRALAYLCRGAYRLGRSRGAQEVVETMKSASNALGGGDA